MKFRKLKAPVTFSCRPIYRFSAFTVDALPNGYSKIKVRDAYTSAAVPLYTYRQFSRIA